MNPRLVEPGFAVVCLHADVPARPGKDQDYEDQAQGAGQHVEPEGYLHGGALCKRSDASVVVTVAADLRNSRCGVFQQSGF